MPGRGRPPRRPSPPRPSRVGPRRGPGATGRPPDRRLPRSPGRSERASTRSRRSSVVKATRPPSSDTRSRATVPEREDGADEQRERERRVGQPRRAAPPHGAAGGARCQAGGEVDRGLVGAGVAGRRTAGTSRPRSCRLPTARPTRWCTRTTSSGLREEGRSCVASALAIGGLQRRPRSSPSRHAAGRPGPLEGGAFGGVGANRPPSSRPFATPTALTRCARSSKFPPGGTVTAQASPSSASRRPSSRGAGAVASSRYASAPRTGRSGRPCGSARPESARARGRRWDGRLGWARAPR